jgi:uncharacterized tellurite resistance protein B-like protein
MIDSLLKFFGRTDDLPDEQCVQERLRHAVAVLLVEIARADHNLHDVELAEVQGQLVGSFELNEADASDLLDRACRAVEESVSLHEFTRILHAEMSYAEKAAVIEMLWRIALADRDIDKYEDYMIAKIAELLYIARGDVIRLRQRVIDSMA